MIIVNIAILACRWEKRGMPDALAKKRQPLALGSTFQTIKYFDEIVSCYLNFPSL
jgi:hypothetical protein